MGATKKVPLAFVLGTRDTDPNAKNQGTFEPSSSWMPPFMRVNPILNWTYGHVWHFLRLFNLPYCALYDHGYTSLGTIKDTLPCPALLKKNVDDDIRNSTTKYWPAYMLHDWDQERAGRIKKDTSKKKTSATTTTAIASTAAARVEEENAPTTLAKTTNNMAIPL